MSTQFVYHDSITTAPRAALDESVDAVAESVRPSGPAAAVVLAAGLASFALGLLTVLTAASAALSDALTLSERVGDVSGVTSATAVFFFATWGVLAVAWRHADPPLLRVAAVTAVLIALGLLGTFPPFFNTFAG